MVGAAIAFTWLGLVLGISFLEAPLKLRAPGVTTRVGLGIGRVVFAALNRVEMLLAAALLVAVLTGSRTSPVLVTTGALVALLAVQPGRGPAGAEPPLGPGTGRRGRTAQSRPLRLHRTRAGQGRGLDHPRRPRTHHRELKHAFGIAVRGKRARVSPRRRTGPGAYGPVFHPDAVSGSVLWKRERE